MLKVYDDDAQELDLPQVMLSIRPCRTRYVEDTEVPQLPPVVNQHIALDQQARDWAPAARVLTVEDNVNWHESTGPQSCPIPDNSVNVNGYRLQQNQDPARREAPNVHEMPAEPQRYRYELDAGPRDTLRGVHQHVTAEQNQSGQDERNAPFLHHNSPVVQHHSENHSRSGRPHRHEIQVMRQNGTASTSDHFSGPASLSSQHGDTVRSHQTSNNRAAREMPPVASQNAFNQIGSMGEPANAHRGRSGSLNRGRPQSTHSIHPERRASISCDRNDAAIYANRPIETFRDSPPAHQGSQDPRAPATARQVEELQLARRNTNEPSRGAIGDNYYGNNETDDHEIEQKQGRSKRRKKYFSRKTLRDEDEYHKGQSTTKGWSIFSKKGNSLPLS